LSQEEASKKEIERIKITEKTFRWLFNEDAMATEKPAKESAISPLISENWRQ